MVKPVWSLALLFCVAATQAQTKKLPSKPNPVKPQPTIAPLLKNANDSVSYAIGMSLATFYREQGINNVNSALVSRALNDAMKGKTTLLTEEQMNMSISNYLQQLKREKSAAARQVGEAFLAANKAKPGVVTLPSGLQYQIIKEGTGPRPQATDTVRCHYHGTLIDGTIFDSSVDRGKPIDYPVNRFITGWVEALQLMPVGSKWKLFVPSELAYGDQASGKIAGGSTLIFDMELIEILSK